MKKLSLLMILALVATNIMGAAPADEDIHVLREMMESAFRQNDVTKVAQLVSLGAKFDVKPSCDDVRGLIRESAAALEDETIFNAFKNCMEYPEDVSDFVSHCDQPNVLDALKKLRSSGVNIFSEQALQNCTTKIAEFERRMRHSWVAAVHDGESRDRCQAVQNFLVEAGKQERLAREEAVLKRIQEAALQK